MRQSNIVGMLWICISVLPWILPTHNPPWPAFYSEWLWAGMLLALAVWIVLTSDATWEVHRTELAVLLVASIPLMQGLTGIYLFPSESILVAAYIAMFAFAVGLGRHLFTNCEYQAVDWMLTGLLASAIISTGLALYQWWAIDGLGLMVPAMAVGGGRVIANVGQANNLSTLMVWGVAALWWAYERKKINVLGAAVGAAYLLLGVAMTGSRTGWIQLSVLGLCAVIAGCRSTKLLRAASISALATWFASLVFVLPFVSAFIWGTSSRSVSEITSVGLRSKFWAMALDAIWQKPWVGYGWNQTVLAQVALAKEYPNLGEYMGHAHNLVLDLLIWNGLPLGCLVVLAGLVWLVKRAQQAQCVTQRMLLTFVAIFTVHAMLEMPYVYAFFLLPVGLVLGTISAATWNRPVFILPRAVVGGLSVLATVAMALVFVDYGNSETYLTARGMVAARIAGATMPASPTIFLLSPLQESLERIHTEPVRNMSTQDLEALRKASLRYPTSGAPFRYVKAAALNGRTEDALSTLATLCAMFPKKECEASGRDAIAAQQ